MSVAPDHPLNAPAGIMEIRRALLRTSIVIAVGLAAFVAWANLAPLATSIQTQGTLKSAARSFDVQHPFGGRVATVDITEFEAVDAGQVLLRLDVASEVAQLSQVERQIGALQEEQNVIGILANSLASDPATRPDLGQGAVALRYASALNLLQGELTRIASSASEYTRRLELLSAQLEATDARVSSMRARLSRLDGLVTKGLESQTASDELRERVLSVENERSSHLARQEELRGERAGLQAEADLALARFRERILDTQLSNLKRLPDLERQKIQLSDRIDNAQVRAPVSGTVSTLSFGSSQMFVPQGGTVFTISQPLSDMLIDFRVPPMNVDQVHPGMQGLLVFPSLPQRSAPKLRVEITSLSDSAARDADGNTVGFDGRAKVLEDDLAKLKALEAEGTRLVAGMPVSVTFTGRSTTFADYLVGPFLAGMGMALQD